MKVKLTKILFFLLLSVIVNFNSISYASGENNTSDEMKIYDKVKNMLLSLDKKITTLDKKLPTLAYKALDFKAGVGMDFGSNGIAISLIGNMYHNFTQNIAVLAGMEYRYNMYQIKKS